MVPPTDTNGPCALNFRLLPSRLPDRAFCPVLVCTIRGVEIVRILSPDLGEPFLSLSRIFLLCAIPPSIGLQRFSLQLPFSYDVSLANLAPFDDVWVSLRTARRVARELGVEEELGPLLEWSGRKAFSDVRWDESGRCVLIQNWYARMCERPFAPFYRVEAKDEKHITVVDPAELQKLRETTLNAREQAFMKAWEKITTWSSFAYEEWRDNQSSQKPSRPTTVTFEDPASLTLQSAFPSLLYEATYSLEELLSSSSHSPSGLGLTNGMALHLNGHAVPPRTTLQSILDLATSHARILLYVWAMNAALDAPASQGMRNWLQGLPPNPSPVPGASPLPTPVQSQAVKAQLTPPSSPPPAKRLKEEKGAEKPKEDKERDEKLAAERDAMAHRLAELEKNFEVATASLVELEASKERVQQLEARLAEVEKEKALPPVNGSEADVKVDEEDEEAILARLEERRDKGLRSPSPDRASGRRSRSHSPESDSSTIRPSSPIYDHLHDALEEVGAKVGVLERRTFSVGRMMVAWSALIVVFVALWMGIMSAHNAGWATYSDIPAAAKGALEVMLKTAGDAVKMLSEVAP
ncbi:hypothetical protein CALVIDRAFT_541502 [Calocera viscosa TUFC12733]|uniref:Uncharacterized protein n=1 Tax=Calocera viscosa (strain TUFC12733) TaxID=1330018 RepID=A0A167HL13_CALVF|nr:hypothetical protein CALVIDRAFT_541502 [Calocera viscosa TUFC12733]